MCVSIVVEAGHIICDPGSCGIGSRPGLQDTDHRRGVCVHPSTAPDRSLCLDQKEEAYWWYVTLCFLVQPLVYVCFI